MSIGQKGMIVAAKILALAATDLLVSSQILEEAHKEFKERMNGRTFTPAIPRDQKPPLPDRADKQA
jgi:aminobenzoyl-glutamate utilization protein B